MMKIVRVGCCVGVLGLAFILAPSRAAAEPGVNRDPVAVCGIPNGCGPEGAPSTDKVRFNPSCSTHDKCYAILGKLQSECDGAFLQDMYAQCGGPIGGCADMARGFYTLPAKLGKGPYETAQQCAANVARQNGDADAVAIIKRAPDDARGAGLAAVQDVVRGAGLTRVEFFNEANAVKASSARVSQLLALHSPPAAAAGSVAIAQKPMIITDPNSKAAQLSAIASKMTPIVDDTNAKMAKRPDQLANYVLTTAQAALEAALTRRVGEVTALAQEARTAAQTPSVNSAIAIQKASTARSKYNALRTAVAEDVKAGSEPGLKPLGPFLQELKSNSASAAALKAQAEAIAAAASPAAAPAPVAPAKAPIAPAAPAAPAPAPAPAKPPLRPL